MNILQVHGWWQPVNPGGVITMINAIVGGLGPGHAVDVLVNQWDAGAVTRIDDIAGGGVYALRLRAPAPRGQGLRGLLGFLRDLPGTQRRLRRFLRDRAVDVLHLHYLLPYQVHFALARMVGGPPYVLTLHRGDVLGFPERSWLDRWAMRLVVRRAGRVVAVSGWLARTARETFGVEVDIGTVHNGLDFAQMTRAAGSGGDLALPLPFFAMVGNLHAYKGQDVAVDAWARVLEGHPDHHLVIVGEGDERAALERRIAAGGLGQRVHLLGHRPRGDVLAIMRQAEGFLFPSRNEGFGLVLIEAGANGLPCICSDIPPFREIAEAETQALFAPSEDAAALAAAVTRLIDEPGLARRLGDALRERVQSAFSVEVMMRRYGDLYAAVRPSADPASDPRISRR